MLSNERTLKRRNNYVLLIRNTKPKFIMLQICNLLRRNSSSMQTTPQESFSEQTMTHRTKLRMLGLKSISGTSKTKPGQGGLVRVALFWKSHCVTCVPACVILYHVTISCKRVYMNQSKARKSSSNVINWPVGHGKKSDDIYYVHFQHYKLLI